MELPPYRFVSAGPSACASFPGSINEWAAHSSLLVSDDLCCEIYVLASVACRAADVPQPVAAGDVWIGSVVRCVAPARMLADCTPETMPGQPGNHLTGNPPFRPFISGRIVYSIREFVGFVVGTRYVVPSEQSPVRYVHPRRTDHYECEIRSSGDARTHNRLRRPARHAGAQKQPLRRSRFILS